MKKVNKYKFKLQPKHKETPKGVSKTIQGETYSIRDLLEKHTKGILPPAIVREPIWSEDADHDSVDYESIQRMDRTIKDELKAQVRENSRKLEKDIETQKEIKAKQKAEAKAKVQKDENAVKVESNDSTAEAISD